MKKIPFLKPNLVKNTEYLRYLSNIDETRHYSNYGPLNALFERRLVDEYFGHEGAVTTVSNGTTGLMLAISQCKRPRGRYAVMPSFTFAATPLAALWCGLEPYFVDIRDDDWCMNEELLDDVIKQLGDEIAVVVPYATFGANMDLSFYLFLHDSGIPVVVDAAASFGACRSAGHFGKGFPGAVVFSFHATKAFAIGEGGLVYSGRSEFIDRIRQAGNFGFSDSRECMLQGLNGKLSEYSAAIALATLDVYSRKIQRRQSLYNLFLALFDQAQLLQKNWSFQKVDGTIPFQFMTVLCPAERSNAEFVNGLSAMGIESRTYFGPACHQQSNFKSAPSTVMTTTERIAKRVLNLPFWEEMTRDDVKRVVEGLRL